MIKPLHITSLRITSLRITSFRRLAIVAALTACWAPRVPAQSQRPLSVELNAGIGIGRSPRRHLTNGTGAAIDALLGYRPDARSGLVVGIGGSGQAFGVGAACEAVEGGSCPTEFPAFWTLAALAGFETQNGGARVLVGPAIARSDSTNVGAAQARVELAKQLLAPLSLLASARVTYVPAYRGASYRLGSLSVGFRLR